MKNIVLPSTIVQTSRPHYRANIDGLRAVAITSVVAYHAFPSIFQGGFIGVDIFFVISGFLISTIIFNKLINGDFSFADFYARRIRRIFPSLILILVAVYVCGWIILLPDEYRHLGKHIAAGVAFSQNFVLMNESGYFDTVSELKPLLHLWSLSIEEQFYIIYPLLLWSAWRWKLSLLKTIFALMIISFYLNIATIGEVNSFFLPQTRVWELLAGSLLSYLTTFSMNSDSQTARSSTFFSVFRIRILKDIASTLGLFLIVYAVFGLKKDSSFPGWWAVVPVAGTLLLLIAGDSAWINRKLLSNRIVVLVGLISYPLYIWHWPLLSFLSITRMGTPSVGLRLLSVTIGFLLAILTYRFIELPMRFGNNLWRKTVSLSAFAMFIGLVGFYTFEKNGFDFRFTKKARELTNFKYDFKSDARSQICWVGRDQAPNSYAEECCNSDVSDLGRTVIWGDSHAARLYPGLKLSLGSKQLAQFTRDSCPPILDVGHKNCVLGNKYSFGEILRHKYDTVILFAVWNQYDEKWSDDSGYSVNLKKTILLLKQSGVKNIFVIGPAVQWMKDLPKLVYDEWKLQRFTGEPPERMSYGLDDRVSRFDKNLSFSLKDTGVIYISIVDFQCNSNGCLTRLPDNPTNFITWDYGHLTTNGALYVSKKLSLSKK